MLHATGLVKRYGGVTALDGADLELRGGEIHALVGENGAGKSTLVKILSGALGPDGGEIALNGTPTRFTGPRDAAARGIAMVAQELSLFPDLSVAENLFVTALPRRFGLLSPAEMERRAAPVLAGLGLDDVPVHAPVAGLNLADRQLLEVCRALLATPRVLMLDEPTSALPPAAVDRLETVLRQVAARGIAVLYISHMLQEVRRMADRVSVLRDGRPALRGERAGGLSLDDLVRAMLGDGAPAPAPAGATADPVAGDPERTAHDGAVPDAAALTLSHVTVPGAVTDMSLSVAAGEIVGVAGLEGAGHRAVLDVVCGLRRPASGRVTLPGGGTPRSVRDAVRQGVAFVPGDRKRFGLMLDQTVWENATAVRWLGAARGSWWQHRRSLRARAQANLRRMRFHGDIDGRTGELSGGNQQKVVFAKWLDTDPSVIVLDDPTRGVDVGARGEMHDIVRDLAATGRVVLLASTDLAELTELCHRVVVFQRGEATGELRGAELTEQRLSTAVNGS
ncbi:sugar ABC transporter ATP-binding protein [Mangrovihabitans endophyticus]|uniref:Ribose ABC transporter ATP-binding protein n=1 Tax=Mangrovihabitans endophyticus TaxID=1751298 RepID=A0A8J3C098_9ACTN|nr:sugar ABC transporter ATP-binding protein [Mangrovihabitans endophyticus]GGL00408.1 ribose ABC transporter ATP-binding protein [Mangrovihabitans endophyticus]